jgi:hypothetical protein
MTFAIGPASSVSPGWAARFPSPHPAGLPLFEREFADLSSGYSMSVQKYREGLTFSGPRQARPASADVTARIKDIKGIPDQP